MNPLKLDLLFSAALLLAGTALWTRIAVQGFEGALVSTAIEWSMSHIRPLTTLLPGIAVSGRPGPASTDRR